MNHGAADGHADIFARNNTVTLANTVVQSTSTDPKSDMQIIGNFAEVTEGSAPEDGGVNTLSALGDGSTVNLSITNGYLNYSTSGNGCCFKLSGQRERSGSSFGERAAY